MLKPNPRSKFSISEDGLNLLNEIVSGQAKTFMVDKTQICYEKRYGCIFQPKQFNFSTGVYPTFLCNVLYHKL